MYIKSEKIYFNGSYFDRCEPNTLPFITVISQASWHPNITGFENYSCFALSYLKLLNFYVASANKRSICACSKTTDGMIFCSIFFAKSRDKSTSDILLLVPTKYLSSAILTVLVAEMCCSRYSQSFLRLKDSPKTF